MNWFNELKDVSVRILKLLLLLLIPVTTLATQQAPDILFYDGKELRLEASWAYPSPLETYFKQSGKASPFKGTTTALYRGHIATWLIENDYFYLNQIEAGRESLAPTELGEGLGKQYSSNGSLSADWFSGVLQATEMKYTDSERSIVAYYYFNVKHGQVLQSVRLTKDDLEHKYNSESKGALPRLALIDLYKRYTDYYFQLSTKDEVIWNGKVLKLNSTTGMSPLLKLYENDHLNWPFNWNNSVTSGAPNGRWSIDKDNRLFIESVQIRTGSNIYKADVAEVPLSQVIPGSEKNEATFASWVDGIYLLEEGSIVQEHGYSSFKVEIGHFVRINKGIIEEHYEVDATAELAQIESSADQNFIKLFEQWKSFFSM